MNATALSAFFNETFKDDLNTLPEDKFYALYAGKDGNYINGACGMTSVREIVNAIGVSTEFQFNQRTGTDDVILRKRVRQPERI